MTEIYQGDTGLEILVDCGCDITGAANPALLVRAPSGTVCSLAGTLAAKDGLTRCIRYVTKAGDLAEAGVYRVQASLTLGDWSGLGKTARLTVRPRFN